MHAVLLSLSFFFSFFFSETGFYQVGRASLEPMTLFFLCAGTPGMAHHIQLHSCSSTSLDYLMWPTVGALTYHAYIRKAEARGRLKLELGQPELQNEMK